MPLLDYMIAFLDVLITSLVIGPLVVIFWAVTWDYFLKNPDLFPLWWTLYVFAAVQVVFTIMREPLLDLPRKGWTYMIYSRIYVYISAVTTIGFWRSFWSLLDQYASFEVICLSLVASLAVMIAFGGCPNLLSPPFVASIEQNNEAIFMYSTAFNSTSVVRMRGSTAGITDGFRGTSKKHYAFITVLDHVLAAVVISPLVVAYWRGTWSLMDYFVFPANPEHSLWVSLCIGYGGTIFFTLVQYCSSETIHPDVHRLSFYFTSRTYTYAFGFVCVNLWRGGWMALDYYTPPEAIYLTIILSVLVMALTKTLRNISAAPFAIATDRYEGYFEVPTYFKTTSGKYWVYLLDCVFSVCVVGSLVVFIWRGSWGLLDAFLLPENPGKSAFISVAVGYLIVFITFALQPMMKYLARTLKGIPRIFVVDIYLLFSFGGTINVWRGIWNSLNVYFFPERPALSNLLTHSASFILLVLIKSSNSILVRGVYIDGQEEGEQCVDFPCYYIRLFFQERRRKKLLRAGEGKHGRRKSEESTLMASGASPKAIIVSKYSNQPFQTEPTNAV